MTASTATTTRFLGIELETEGDVLRPRAETELLATRAIALLAEAEDAPRVIDMCCGSGNLGVAIAVRHPSARVWGCDLTDGAVTVARANAARLGVAERLTICQGDMFGALDGSDFAGPVDMIVCNPPYISTYRLEGESAHLLESEPREAFDGGPYGISLLQRVVREAPPFLRPGGWLLFEFGLGQERQVTALVARAAAYGPVSFATDADGAPRVAIMQRKAEPTR